MFWVSRALLGASIAGLWRFILVLTGHGMAQEFVSCQGCFGLSPDCGFGPWGSGWGSCRLSPGPAPCLCPAATFSDRSRWLWIMLVGGWLSVMLITRLKSLPFPRPLLEMNNSGHCCGWVRGQLCSPSVPESPKNPLQTSQVLTLPPPQQTLHSTANSPTPPQPHFIFIITPNLTITFHSFASQWENIGIFSSSAVCQWKYGPEKQEEPP